MYVSLVTFDEIIIFTCLKSCMTETALSRDTDVMHTCFTAHWVLLCKRRTTEHYHVSLYYRPYLVGYVHHPYYVNDTEE